MLRKKQRTEVWNIELISKQPCQLLVFPFLSLQFKFSAHPCILINLCCLIPFSKYQSNLLLLIDWSVQDTCIPSPSIWVFLYNSSYLLQTPDNSNSFWFPRRFQLSGVDCIWTNPALSPQTYHALPTKTNLLPQQWCFWFTCCFRWETRKNHQRKMSQSKLKTTRTKGALNNWLILLVRKINEKYWLLTRWGALKYLLLAHIRKMTANMSFKWLFHSPGKCSDFIIDNLKKLKNTCKSLCTYPITFRSYTFWNTRLATLTLFRREGKKCGYSGTSI